MCIHEPLKVKGAKILPSLSAALQLTRSLRLPDFRSENPSPF